MLKIFMSQFIMYMWTCQKKINTLVKDKIGGQWLRSEFLDYSTFGFLKIFLKVAIFKLYVDCICIFLASYFASLD